MSARLRDERVLAGLLFHPLTLAFADEELEQRFRWDEARASRRNATRVGTALAALWIAMVPAVWLLGWPEPERVTAPIIFGMIPYIVLATAAGRWLRFRWRRQILLGGANVVATFVGYQMVVEMGQVERWGYFVVLIAAIIVLFLMRLRFASALIVVGIYGPLLLVRQNLLVPPKMLSFDVGLMSIGAAVAVISARQLELARREAFCRRERLDVVNENLRQAQAELAQAEKMSSLGKLVAGVAHDLNTPLGAIRGTQQTLDTAVDKLRGVLENNHPDAFESRRVSRTLSVLRDAARTIAEGASRVAAVVERLRSFARLDEASLQDVHISTCIEDVLAIVEHRRPSDVVIESDIVGPTKLRCYPADLNQWWEE